MKSSPPSPSSLSSSYTDRQFFVTGLQMPLKATATSEVACLANGKKAEFKETSGESTAVEGQQQQYIEIGSDSDSGTGTAYCESLESPTRESPLTFRPNESSSRGRNSLGSSKQRNPHADPLKEAITEDKLGCGMYAGNEDDGYTVSPGSDTAQYSDGYILELSNHNQSILSSRLSNVISKFAFPVEEKHKCPRTPTKTSSELQMTYSGDADEYARDPRLSPVIAQSLSPSDKNNNKHFFPSPGGAIFSSFPVPDLDKTITTNESFQKGALCTDSDWSHHDVNGDAMSRSYAAYNDINFRRHEIQAKCQDMFGSRSSVFGSREIYNGFGSQDVQSPSRVNRHIQNFRRFNSSFDVLDYDIRTRPDENLTDKLYGSPSCNRVIDRIKSPGIDGHKEEFLNNSHDGFSDKEESLFDYHQNDSFYDNHMKLNDSLSTIHTDYSSSFTQSDCQKRRYNCHQMITHHPGLKHWDSPSKAGHLYKKRHEESSFNSSMGIDSQFNSEGKARRSLFQGNMNASQYRRARSISYEYGSGGDNVWQSSIENSYGVRNLDPALQQPFSDDAPATLPRPNKPSGRVESEAPEQIIHTPVKGRPRRPFRRWTNTGVEETSVSVDNQSTLNSTKISCSSSRFRGGWFNFSSMLKSKKHSSTTSLATEETRKSGTGSETVEGIAIQPMVRGSVQLIIDSSGSAASPSGTPEPKGSNFMRSSSFPNPERRSKTNESSFLEKVRSRLTLNPKKKSPLKENGPLKADGNIDTRQQSTAATQMQADPRTMMQPYQNPSSSSFSEASSAASPVSKPAPFFSRFNSLQEPLDFDESVLTVQSNFATYQPQRPRPQYHNDSKKYGINDNYVKQISQSCSVAATVAGPASAYMPSVDGYNSLETSGFCARSGRSQPRYSSENDSTSGEVSQLIFKVDEFVDAINATIISNNIESDDRTIAEEDFNEYRQKMIVELKQFIDRCKRMVIEAPASISGFLKELQECRRSLGDVINRYCGLIDCTSLPADREKIANRIKAVAFSFRDTVIVGADVAGLSARHPNVKILRVRANQLVADLAQFMKVVREMHYNRLSRRF